MQKIGYGSTLESTIISRRTEIRLWSRSDVRTNLEGPLRNVTVLARDAGKVSRIPLAEALYRHMIDGNALLELKEDDLMQWIGISEVGVAKTLLRTVANLVLSAPTQCLKSRPSSAPTNRTIRYSSLDPFDGWDSEQPLLHPKRNRLFRVSTLHPTMVVKPKESVAAQVDVVAQRVEMPEAATQACLETAIASANVTSTFALGPLERERRVAEARAMFDVIQSAQQVTLGWVVDCVLLHFALDSSVATGFAQQCYMAVRTSREAQVVRPWSATKLQKGLKSLPEWDTLSNIRNLNLSRGDFVVAVATLTDSRIPHDFDSFFRFLSQKFGSEHLEVCRRTNSLRLIFEKGVLSSDSTRDLLSVVTSRDVKVESTGAVDFKTFCDLFLQALSHLNSESFDHQMMKVSVALSKQLESKLKTTGGRAFLTEKDLERIVQQSNQSKMILLMSSTINPTSLMERYFLTLRDTQSPLITSRQKFLSVLAVGGDDSIVSTIGFILTNGLEKGFWVLVVCSASPENCLLNALLRKLACLIACRPTSSISSQFRIFVHCPIDTVDIRAIPQIAQSSSIPVPLVR